MTSQGFGNSSGSPGGYGALFIVLGILGVSAIGWTTVHYPLWGWTLVAIAIAVGLYVGHLAEQREAARKREEKQR